MAVLGYPIIKWLLDTPGRGCIMPAMDTLSRRISHFRKALGRGLGRKPNALEGAQMLRAAMLAAQAEQVLADPTATINDKVRIDGAARRALLDVQAMLRPKRTEDDGSALERYLDAKHSGAVA